METMKLDYNNWDLDLDAQGNLATINNDGAIAQNVATACLVFKGEDFFDSNFGVPYKNVLGEMPALSLISEYMIETASTVDEVNNVDVQLKYLPKERRVGGTILINGDINVNF